MLESLERFVSPDEDAALSLNFCLDLVYVGRQAVVEASHSWLKRFRKLSSPLRKNRQILLRSPTPRRCDEGV